MTLPSFSIVLETENLANADLEGLTHALASLVHQDLPPQQANEVILIDSGDAPPDLLAQLCDRYPWIKVHPAPPNTGYYKAKMLGAELATGEIIVYADSDCLYEPHWLRTILTTFAENEQIQILAGETTTRGRGPYGTAMALVYIFPQFSGQTELTTTHQYFLNNVAFRRQFLLNHPIPAELPLYRGNCVVHGEDLRCNGHTIWLNPKARATHAPPSDLSHFFWRFLLIGHDYYWQKKLITSPSTHTISHRDAINPGRDAINPGRDAINRVSTPDPKSHTPNPTSETRDPTASGFGEKFNIFRDRMARLFQNNPRHALYFPFAIPIILIAALLIYLGYLITRVNPDYLVKTYDRLLEGAD